MSSLCWRATRRLNLNMLAKTMSAGSHPAVASAGGTSPQWMRPLDSPIGATQIHQLRFTSAEAGGRSEFYTKDEGDNKKPHDAVLDAMSALERLSSQLEAVSTKVEQGIYLPGTGQRVTLKDIVLHSRDADSKAFQEPMAKLARKEVMPLALEVEKMLQSLAVEFTTVTMPQMAQATMVCKETPCGGATWKFEVPSSSTDDDSISRREEVNWEDTPCGKLDIASQQFVKLTYDTREHVALGSRAACLLRLATHHDMPLREVRMTKEGREEMGRVFTKECVVTPWLRSEEEYTKYFSDDSKETTALEN